STMTFDNSVAGIVLASLMAAVAGVAGGDSVARTFQLCQACVNDPKRLPSDSGKVCLLREDHIATI
ncbi:MAG TPA: hypothetical protein PKA09_25395, partial [Geminicoccus sp.]|nr:hypothetical protein [Geminicoccus sp.]